MKKYLTYCAMAFVLAACSSVPEVDLPQDQSNLQIGVYVAGGGATKVDVHQINAGSPGEGEYGENYLTTLDFFFYQSSSADVPTAAAIYYIHKDNVHANTTWTLSDMTESETQTRIFGEGNRAIVYVIANYTPASPFSGTEARSALRQMVAESDFNRVTSDAEGKQDGIPQECFVMEGQTEIQRNLVNGLYFMQGRVPLYRSASKIRLKVTIPESLYDAGDPSDYANHPDRRVKDGNGFVWIPQPESMKVILVHGVKKGIICAMDDSYHYDFEHTSNNYFAESNESNLYDNYGHSMRLSAENTDAEDNVVSKSYEHTVPMYSYPTDDWKHTPSNETHMTLVLQWARLGDDGTVVHTTNTLYQIPIAVNPEDPTYQLKPNRYYRMEVNLGIMGSFELDDPIELYPSTYIVLDWSTMKDDSDDAHAQVNMSQTAYLAVESHRDTLNNVRSHGVGYASSHDVTVTVTKVEYLNYKYKVARMARITPDQPNRIYYYTQNSTTGAWDVYESYETSNGIYASYVADATSNEGFITLTHTIASSQYTPANIYVTISNGVVEDEEIVFTQYPPISIDGHLSEGNTFVNRVSNASTNNDIRTASGEWVGAITEKSSAAGTGSEFDNVGNSNPMLYSIKISSFSESDNYVLGDPRVSSPDNNLGHSDASWSADMTITFTRPSSGTYETQTGTYYYTYSQYQNRTGNQIQRESNNQRNSSYITLPSGESWDNHTSEATAYGPDANNYYYWRTGSGSWLSPYYYYRARYYSTVTRYVVTNERALENYYPTNPTGTADMIAPEILIASSYGKTGYSTAGQAVDNMTWELAEMRCALYQEGGYPAGRWRLPTFSEVKFIMSLSTSGTIPALFNMGANDSEGYWCANGRVITVNNVVQLQSPPGTAPTAPRCVYDLWYWGDEHETYATTWHLGDND